MLVEIELPAKVRKITRICKKKLLERKKTANFFAIQNICSNFAANFCKIH